MLEFSRIVYCRCSNILKNNPFFYSCCMLVDCIAINNKLDNFDNNKKLVFEKLFLMEKEIQLCMRDVS